MIGLRASTLPVLARSRKGRIALSFRALKRSVAFATTVLFIQGIRPRERVHRWRSVLDGNGRVGRLPVTLLLCAEAVLSQPLLYVSLYLKQHRDEYYTLLDAVRGEGDWEAWLSFVAEGVRRLAQQARDDADRIRGIKRIAGSALRIQQVL
jgi:hypothetical protein